MSRPQVLQRGREVTLPRHEPEVAELSGIVLDALAMTPPAYFFSIFGPPLGLVPPYRKMAELQMLDLWQLRRAARYLSNLTIPSLPLEAPPLTPPLVEDLFWDPSQILQFPDHNGSYTTFPEEAWFLVNGVATNEGVAQLNAACVADLFHRPVTVIQNATDGLLIDLVQCAIGKQWRKATEPAIRAFPVLYDALTDPAKRRVVMIAHSQGTIIAANLLRMLAKVGPFEQDPCLADSEPMPTEDPAARFGLELNLDDFEPLAEEHLAKLEVYCFATCATEMRYLRPPAPGRAPIPHLEHFGNSKDLVARLGMLAPRPRRWRVEIDGPLYVHEGRWGHLLNMHYLFDIADHQRLGHRRGGTGTLEPYRLLTPHSADRPPVPRLFDSINGGGRVPSSQRARTAARRPANRKTA